MYRLSHKDESQQREGDKVADDGRRKLRVMIWLRKISEENQE